MVKVIAQEINSLPSKEKKTMLYRESIGYN